MAVMLAAFNEEDFRLLPRLQAADANLPGDLEQWCANNDFNVGRYEASGDGENGPLVTVIRNPTGAVVSVKYSHLFRHVYRD